MTNPGDSVDEKIKAIFRELAGERAATLEATRLPTAITSTITLALAGENATAERILESDRIAFHLTDWSAEAAFLVALHLFPERFTAEDIRDGVLLFLLHAPAHVIAAARLSGHSVEDIFKDVDRK